MGMIEARLIELGVVLPKPPVPGGNYLNYRKVGSMVYLPGVICSINGDVSHKGQLGVEFVIPQGYEAARICALNLIANLKEAVGDLDQVKQIVTVNGYVNCVSGFTDSPAVINGASDLLVQIFGDAGRHVRAAIGVAGLPRGAAVEVQMTAEIH